MPSSSLFLRLGAVLLATCITPSIQEQRYALKDNYDTSSFFDQFNFFTGPDPTHGFVNYVDRGTAANAGLISTAGGVATFGADHTNIAGGGRTSVRLSSKAVYTHGLFIADFDHLPDSVCGSWPAFWTFGPNWPFNGEIDIIENVHRATNNLVTLHSGSNCIVNSNGGQTGALGWNNCDSSSGDTRGCSVADPRGNSFGSGFNSAGGGVYAMQWTSGFIKVWFFPRGTEPGDINGAAPNPDLWGSPVANFQGCDIDSHFRDHQIIFDMTFCGDWAGNTFANDPVCGKLGSCTSYVANNPGAFSGVYFGVRGLKVYQLADVVIETKVTTTTTSTTISSTTSSSTTSTTSTTSSSSSTTSTTPTSTTTATTTTSTTSTSTSTVTTTTATTSIPSTGTSDSSTASSTATSSASSTGTATTDASTTGTASSTGTVTTGTDSASTTGTTASGTTSTTGLSTTATDATATAQTASTSSSSSSSTGTEPFTSTSSLASTTGSSTDSLTTTSSSSVVSTAINPTSPAPTSSPSGIDTLTKLTASSTPSTTDPSASPIPTEYLPPPPASVTFSKVGPEGQGTDIITTTNTGGTGSSTVYAATSTVTTSCTAGLGARNATMTTPSTTFESTTTTTSSYSDSSSTTTTSSATTSCKRRRPSAVRRQVTQPKHANLEFA